MHFTVVVKAVSYMVEVQSLSSWTADAGLRVCAVCSPFSQLLLLNDFRISSLGSLLETMNLVGFLNHYFKGCFHNLDATKQHWRVWWLSCSASLINISKASHLQSWAHRKRSLVLKLQLLHLVFWLHESAHTGLFGACGSYKKMFVQMLNKL